ncbi:hypothetical protein D9M68_969640 [compost metagenome]
MRELLEANIHGDLAPADSRGGTGGKAVGKLVDALVEFGGGHGMIDEADARGIGSGQRFAAQ